MAVGWAPRRACRLRAEGRYVRLLLGLLGWIQLMRCTDLRQVYTEVLHWFPLMQRMVSHSMRKEEAQSV